MGCVFSEKHGEKLVEKFCLRMEAEDRVRIWRYLTFCIKCLQLGERGFENSVALLTMQNSGFRKWVDMENMYSRVLADEVCFRNLKARVFSGTEFERKCVGSLWEVKAKL